MNSGHSQARYPDERSHSVTRFFTNMLCGGHGGLAKPHGDLPTTACPTTCGEQSCTISPSSHSCFSPSLCRCIMSWHRFSHHGIVSKTGRYSVDRHRALYPFSPWRFESGQRYLHTLTKMQADVLLALIRKLKNYEFLASFRKNSCTTWQVASPVRVSSLLFLGLRPVC